MCEWPSPSHALTHSLPHTHTSTRLGLIRPLLRPHTTPPTLSQKHTPTHSRTRLPLMKRHTQTTHPHTPDFLTRTPTPHHTTPHSHTETLLPQLASPLSVDVKKPFSMRFCHSTLLYFQLFCHERGGIFLCARVCEVGVRVLWPSGPVCFLVKGGREFLFRVIFFFFFEF